MSIGNCRLGYQGFNRITNSIGLCFYDFIKTTGKLSDSWCFAAGHEVGWKKIDPNAN
jgi:hypothetical protein